MTTVTLSRALLAAILFGTAAATHAEQPRTELVLESPQTAGDEIPGKYPVVFATRAGQRCRLAGAATVSWRKPESLLQRIGAQVRYWHDGLMPYTAVHLNKKACLTPAGWLIETVDVSFSSWGTLSRP
jgi:hypothetical protein